MRNKFLTAPIASSFAIGAAAFAEPPGHAKGHDLPPGLAKQGKVPPGHAKKMWQRGEHLPHEYREYQFDDWARVDDDAYLTEITTGLVAQAVIYLLN